MNPHITQPSESSSTPPVAKSLLGGVGFPVVAALLLIAGSTAKAQVSTVNSVIVEPRVIDGLTNAVLTTVTNFPTLISFTETNAGTGSTNTSFAANQDLWQFAVKGQSNAYVFQSNDFFNATMSVTLTGSPISPRKEAGFAFNDVNGNINGQYILDTDGHEVVAFGGNLPFYAFSSMLPFNSGETITMGITILTDSNGKQAIIYSADGISSPPLEFGSPQTNYTLGGYFQIQGENSGVTNSGSAAFANISLASLPAMLGIAAATNNQAVLYWPASASGYVLQSITNVTSTNWTDVTNGEPIVGLLVPATSPASFFRLQAP